MNLESHPTFVGDTDQERRWHKPKALCSMTAGAIAIAERRARKRCSEVDAVRTIGGVASGAPIGPVLREQLWADRRSGAALSNLLLADRFRALAADEGVSVEEIAARYDATQVRPHRQRAGERLAAEAVDPDRPDWVDPERLVSMVTPSDNGEVSEVHVRVVRDAEGAEWVLTTSYDGSEPMVWPHTPAGLKAAAEEGLSRIAAVRADPTAYDAWLNEHDVRETGSSPWTSAMSDGDFLSHTGDHADMHLI